MVDVRAELHHVWAARPQETVGELIPLFGPAYEAERFPPDKREPRNVDSHVTAGRIGRVGVEQTAPRILETEFVDFVRVDRPQVLRGDAGIAEDLLRGARANAFWPKFCAAPCAFTWIPVTVLGLALSR